MQSSFDYIVEVLKTPNFCNKHDIIIVLDKIINTTDIQKLILDYLIVEFKTYISKYNAGIDKIVYRIDIKNNYTNYTFRMYNRKHIEFKFDKISFMLHIRQYTKQKLMNIISIQNDIERRYIDYVIDIFDKLKGDILRNSI